MRRVVCATALVAVLLVSAATAMRPRWYEGPKCNPIASGVSIDPGAWIGDDGVRASAWIVSIRATRYAGDRAGPLVWGASEVPPSASPRPWNTPGISTSQPIFVPLPTGVYRAEVWGGSATTDGNYPDSPPIYEWGIEASDQTIRPAECFFTVAGGPPPPPPPPPAANVPAAIRVLREDILRLRAEGASWAAIKLDASWIACHEHLRGCR